MISQDFSSSHSLSVSNSHSHSIKSGPRMILGWLLQGSVISLLDPFQMLELALWQ